MSGLASLFPPPPPYYKKYTLEAVKRIEELESEGIVPGSAIPSETAPDGSNKDADLAELLPPSPPNVEDRPTYRNFGSIWNVNNTLPSLEASGITQLYRLSSEQGDESSEEGGTLAEELKKLMRSALINFLSLVQTLASDPTQFPSRIEDLRTIFVNMHHLLNTYRPLQNREQLAQAMELEIQTIKSQTEQINNVVNQLTTELTEIEERINRPNSSIPPVPSDSWAKYDLEIN
ncbi:mediator complex subunit [Starmerella bacillaris]|uniref:Mediator of RNA polymerase II transcription subunit 7 n=1 Tax=Starmerella bacillaris TaxID=1247836 RepID=A0AAV5RPP6_STABA|nr:mediator complex subunit [Starmerella bacillaris]